MALTFQDMLIDPDLGSLSNRHGITVCDSSLTSLPASPAASITADSVSLKVGNRVLFTNLSNPAQNNMIYKVEASGTSDPSRIELSLVPDPSGARNPSGAPTTGDFCRVFAGSKAGQLYGWNGDTWANVSFSTF